MCLDVLLLTASATSSTSESKASQSSKTFLDACEPEIISTTYSIHWDYNCLQIWLMYYPTYLMSLHHLMRHLRASLLYSELQSSPSRLHKVAQSTKNFHLKTSILHSVVRTSRTVSTHKQIILILSQLCNKKEKYLLGKFWYVTQYWKNSKWRQQTKYHYSTWTCMVKPPWFCHIMLRHWNTSTTWNFIFWPAVLAHCVEASARHVGHNNHTWS